MSKKKKTEQDQGRFVRETLTGDVRDFLLDHLRDSKKALPWPNLGEKQQAEVIESCTNAAEDLVKKIVNIVALDEAKSITASVEQFTVKGSIKIVLSAPTTDDNLRALGDSVGKAVNLIVSDIDPYTGERAPVVPVPDQHSLIDNDADGEETDLEGDEE